MSEQIKCMYCDSADIELFSLYGNTLFGTQYRCKSCKSIFEVIRFNEEDDEEVEAKSDSSGDEEKQSPAI